MYNQYLDLEEIKNAVFIFLLITLLIIFYNYES